MYMIRLLSVASAYFVVLLEIYSGVIDGPMWWILPGGLFLSLLTALIMFGNELTGSGASERSAGATVLLWLAIVASSFGASWLSNHFGRVWVPDLVEQRVPGSRQGDFTIPAPPATAEPAPAQPETAPEPPAQPEAEAMPEASVDAEAPTPEAPVEPLGIPVEGTEAAPGSPVGEESGATPFTGFTETVPTDSTTVPTDGAGAEAPVEAPGDVEGSPTP